MESNMNASKAYEFASLGVVLSRMSPDAAPHVIGLAADLLTAASGGMQRAAVMECNGCGARYGESNESFSRRQADWERATARVEKSARKKIASAAELLGVPVDRFQAGGDPRGACLRIIGVERNGWGDGYAIPEKGARS